MLRVIFKSLLARKLRLVLTALSVVLGVAFVSGTLILGDTMNSTFDKLFATAYAGTDVGVRGQGGLRGQRRRRRRPGPVPAAVPASVARLRCARSTASRRPRATSPGFAQIVTPDGEVVETSGAPTIGGAWLGDSPLNPYRIQDGAASGAAGEVAIDQATAKDNEIAVGDRIKVLTESGPRDETISGIVGFGERRQPGRRDDHPLRRRDGAGRWPPRHLHRDPRRRRRQRQRRSAARPGRRGAPARLRSTDRRRARRLRLRRHQGRAELLQHLPAGLRRHLDLRRLVHHLQHVLHAGGTAQPRARPAARARSEPPPGERPSSSRPSSSVSSAPRSASVSACCCPSACKALVGRVHRRHPGQAVWSSRPTRCSGRTSSASS